ncbi:MAG: EamA family transporter [Lautropia sp.]|nr:EamA family transporter [Lautropia sp.]
MFPDFHGRLFVLLAVFLQAVGKVAYGVWLVEVPFTVFVFISFSMTAGLFLLLSRQGAGQAAFLPLLMLNLSTALTFLSFFYALKLLEPAVVGALEIGVAPIIALLLTLLLQGERPTAARVMVCLGLLLGCLVLAASAFSGVGFTAGAAVNGAAWQGVLASVAAGAGAVVVTMASRKLVQCGWQYGAVLAHRFYLILPVSLGMALWGGDFSAVEWDMPVLLAVLAVSLLGVTLPLYLLQIGIGRCDTHTVLVSMAALPVITFALEMLSPVYAWSWLTAVGVLVVAAFVLLDMLMSRR